ncbi:ABC transporter ATP-binding protein [Azospirillum brasilense]|uniref:ABC transporter ATP-binding protein n=1 Tax=Azospirillum brasilense TaxID=192 RepID=UPI003CE52CAA
MRFGSVTAVRDVSLTVGAGEFFSFLGPSGCGKTTILRMVSGFMEPTEGAIRIGGRDMRGIGPNKRPTALIFQNLALFPLMTVAENIGFGLEVRGVPSAERQERVRKLLDLVALPDAAEKKVTELSGGQRQRIAIARALAVEPAVLLLDEPLSALDLKLRQHMRAELRDLQKRTGVTFIYITHDQGEALTMSDRIGVMSRGVLEQVGDGRAIYDHPETAFVAAFVGENNRFAGTVAESAGGMAVLDTPRGRLVGRNPRRLGPGERHLVRPAGAHGGGGGGGERAGGAGHPPRFRGRLHQRLPGGRHHRPGPASRRRAAADPRRPPGLPGGGRRGAARRAGVTPLSDPPGQPRGRAPFRSR